MILISLLNWLAVQFSGTQVTIDFESPQLDSILSVIAVVNYILPVNTMIAILGLVLIIYNIRLIVALIKTIWQLIPIV